MFKQRFSPLKCAHSYLQYLPWRHDVINNNTNMSIITENYRVFTQLLASELNGKQIPNILAALGQLCADSPGVTTMQRRCS